MFNFLAKIGRQRWSRYVTGCCMAFGPAAYYLVKESQHGLIKRLFGAQGSDGRPEQLSEGLERIVAETFGELEHDYKEKPLDVLERKYRGAEKPPLKWFCSSSLDPQIFGNSDIVTGILIGLPSYYNYEKAEDLPDNLFRFSKISLFRKIFTTKKDTEEHAADDAESQVIVDRNSTIGKQYAETLILSREAKKYSIANQIFMGDSFLLQSRFIGTTFNMAFMLALSRGLVSKLGLAGAHVTQRILVYMASGMLGYFSFKITAITIEEGFEKRTKARVLKLGEVYKQGADEFYEKSMMRKKLLDQIISQNLN